MNPTSQAQAALRCYLGQPFSLNFTKCEYPPLGTVLSVAGGTLQGAYIPQSHGGHMTRYRHRNGSLPRRQRRSLIGEAMKATRRVFPESKVVVTHCAHMRDLVGNRNPAKQDLETGFSLALAHRSCPDSFERRRIDVRVLTHLDIKLMEESLRVFRREQEALASTAPPHRTLKNTRQKRFYRNGRPVVVVHSP